MATESHSVPCARCHRTVLVAMSDLHPPCFRNVDEQIECPEIQERRSKGEGMLLLMMCHALNDSLEAKYSSAAVAAVAQPGGWSVVCRTSGDSSPHYSPGQARNQAEIWEARGHADLAGRFRTAADEVERQEAMLGRGGRWGRRGPAAILGVLLLVVAGGAGWSLLGRPSVPADGEPSAPVLIEVPNATPIPDQAAAAAPPAMPPQAMLAMPSATLPPATVAASLQPQGASTDLPPAAAPPAVGAVEPGPVLPGAPAAELPGAAPPSAAPSAGHVDAMVVAPPPRPAAVDEPEMVSLPGGTLAMGSNDDPSERPIHGVTIKPFAISKFPITVGAWNACVAAKVCSYAPTGEDDAPVTNVSWNDAQQFVTWLARVTQKKFRLPSEAEWEYAARGKTRTRFWWGDKLELGMADCRDCNEVRPAAQPVKVDALKPNPFGLYAMGGGVDQWVSDCWHKNYQGAPTDGSSWDDGDCLAHIIRSGSSKNDSSYVRPASRDHYDGRVRYPTHGLRVALPL